ncbi:MAG: hypothetical protein JWN56_818 [Sphingobacteriales bacterium]|nr:hypothetical protein [Sphingobacteriales bacterium]
METRSKETKVKVQRVVDIYNMVPNLIWSIIALVPLVIFCYQMLNLKSILIIVIVSYIPALLPTSMYSRITFIDNPKLLNRIGLNFFNKFTQNGTFINHLIRKKYPDYKVISIKRNSINKIINQTYMLERFHVILFTFFTIIIVYALMKAQWFWAFILIFINVIYNIYPILLQHAIRMRLAFRSKTR